MTHTASFLRRFWKDGFPRLPKIEHAPWELVLMRVGLALTLIQSLGINWPKFQEMPKPHGLGRLFDLTFFSDPAIMGVLYYVYMGALALYVAGIFIVPALAWCSFMLIGMGTLANSQGAIGHSTQLISLVVLTQLVAYAVMWYGDAKQGRWLRPQRSTHWAAMDWTRHIIVAGYVISGVTKWLRTGGEWVERSPYLSLQIIKTNEMHYFNRLEETHNFWTGDFPQFLVDNPFVAQLMFGTGFYLEIFCFIALFGRRASLLIGLGLIMMHVMISAIMSLRFQDHINLLLIFFVNVPFWVAWGMKWGRDTFRTSKQAEKIEP